MSDFGKPENILSQHEPVIGPTEDLCETCGIPNHTGVECREEDVERYTKYLEIGQKAGLDVYTAQRPKVRFNKNQK